MKQDRSILLVEDDADEVYFIQRALQENGVSVPVHVVNDGQSAIDFLSQASDHEPSSATGGVGSAQAEDDEVEMSNVVVDVAPPAARFWIVVMPLL